MQQCDVYLNLHIAGLQGFRFIDDFELAFASQAEAENAHNTLEACLAKFELALNPEKTSIRELPLPLEASWVTQLKRAKPRSSARQQAAGLVLLFDTAISLHKEYPDEAVLQFAIALLQYEVIYASNWDLFQRLVMLCSLPEPACFPLSIRQIVQRAGAGQVGLIAEIAEVANALIITHSPLRHSSEVANAVYACIALGLMMNDAAVEAISACDDPVVALLALDCEQRHLTSRPLDKTLWSTHMKADELYDEFWLLAYEANVKGWLPNISGVDFVANDPNFSLLKSAGVYFYDLRLSTATSSPPASVTPTSSASSSSVQVVILADPRANALSTAVTLPVAEDSVSTDSAISS